MKENELISEFMGIDCIDVDTYLNNNKELKYKTSWDWLMPVVQKIKQVCEGVPPEMIDINLYSNINQVYNAVLEFIKEYNKK